MEQLARARWPTESHSSPVCVSGGSEVRLRVSSCCHDTVCGKSVCEWCFLCLQVRIVPWLMHVPQIPAPTVPVAPIGIITTIAHAHLGIRARTVAMILMNAANSESALTVASAWTHTAHSAVSALLGTAGAHARCPPSPVPPHSVSMGAPAIRPVTTPTSVLACQVQTDKKHAGIHVDTHPLSYSHTHSHPSDSGFPKASGLSRQWYHMLCYK